MLSDNAPSRLGGLRDLVARLSPGERVYLPGSAGETIGLADALCEEAAPPLALTASYVPGINPFPVAKLPPGTTLTSMFAQPGAPRAQEAGVFRHIPLSYGTFGALLKSRRVNFDTAIVHVAPPDAEGRCSLGPAVEFTPLALACSRRVIGVINPQLPRLPHADSIAYADFELVLELEGKLREYDVGAPSEQATVIAARIAEFVDDGTTLQIGLGKVPDALLRMLANRRKLRLHSGMLSDGARVLVEAGAVDTEFLHTSCVHVGTMAYYAWLAERTDFAVRGCEVTHAASVLAGMRRLVAVNSALSVDLFGQANLEMLDGRMVSAVGGAADFARAAALSADGASIIALPATSGRAENSRIVAKLDAPASIPRHDVQVLITEHGAADLRGCTVMERAERIIAVAAPKHRSDLTDAWREIAARL